MDNLLENWGVNREFITEVNVSMFQQSMFDCWRVIGSLKNAGPGGYGQKICIMADLWYYQVWNYGCVTRGWIWVKETKADRD